MNAFAKIDPETFFRFAAEHAEQRYELEKGRIVQQMTGGTRRHGIAARRISMQIEAQIDPVAWTVLQDRGVKVGETIGSSARYPDIVVEPSGEPDDSLSTAAPIMIVEVLSPSTTATDLNTKPSEYLSIAMLDAYVIASQDEPALLIYERQANGAFPAEPTQVDDRAAVPTIKTRRFTVTLDLAGIYKGIA